MNMNIYISKDNEKWLRIQKTSMSGIINQLLDEARHGKHGAHVIAQYETLEEASKSDIVLPEIIKTKEDAIKAVEPKRNTPNVEDGRRIAGKTRAAQLPMLRACCLKKNPCVHWQWNADQETWMNSITGELKEVM